MKLLLDANISWRLCAPLAEHFDECFHVNKIDLAIPPSDTMIWNYARDNDCIIVTHDTDFLQMILTKSCSPKIILLKTGNIDTETALKLLVQAKEAIIEWSEKETKGLEITVKR